MGLNSCGGTRLVQTTNETWTRSLDSPNQGDITFTGSAGSVLIIPKPVAEAIGDIDADTGITPVEGGGANGGDRMDFTIDGVTVGSVEILAGGITKWNFDGILDPIIYRPTPQTTAELTALIPNALLGDIALDSDLGYHVKFDGISWIPLGGGVSTDTEQLLKIGSDNLIMLDPDDLISADLNNSLIKGTDGKLYFNPIDQSVVADIPARDALIDLTTGDLVYVIDATADVTVDAGAALYVRNAAAWDKIAEFESLDIIGGSNRVFAPDTGVAPLTPGKPALFEIKLWNNAQPTPYKDTIVYYTGNDAPAATPTYIWHVDSSENFTLIESPTSGLESTKIDASGGVVTETLGNSTNLGVVRLFTNIDLTNTATVAVQAGETLNGVIDGTFLFSSYSAGTQFRADEVTGGWVVSVVGASTQTGLDTVSLSQSDGDATVSGANPLDLDSANLDVIHDPAGLINITNNSLVIQRDGLYRMALTGHYSTTSPGPQATINVDGVTIAQGNRMDVARAISTARAIKNLTVGQEVTFSFVGGGNVNGVSATLEQLPTTEAVLAGMVTPTSLTSAQISTGTTDLNVAGVTTGVGTIIPFPTTDFNNGMTLSNAGEITVIESGRYGFESYLSLGDVSVDATFELVVDGVSVFSSFSNLIAGNDNRVISYELNLTAGQVVGLYHKTIGNGDTVAIRPNSYFKLTQLHTSTVGALDPTLVPVNDQAASGYYDIGTMRMQWGTETITVDSQAITFPVPFGSTPSVTTNNATFSDVFTMGRAVTTTGFTSNAKNFNGAVITGIDLSWMAIGLKP